MIVSIYERGRHAATVDWISIHDDVIELIVGHRVLLALRGADQSFLHHTHLAGREFIFEVSSSIDLNATARTFAVELCNSATIVVVHHGARKSLWVDWGPHVGGLSRIPVGCIILPPTKYCPAAARARSLRRRPPVRWTGPLRGTRLLRLCAGPPRGESIAGSRTCSRLQMPTHERARAN